MCAGFFSGIVIAQRGGRCSTSTIHTVKIAVYSAEGCCTAITMALTFVEQKHSSELWQCKTGNIANAKFNNCFMTAQSCQVCRVICFPAVSTQLPVLIYSLMSWVFNANRKRCDHKFASMSCHVLSCDQICNFCLIEVRAMVVAIQQPSEECTAIFTVCIVSHRPPPCAVIIHKTCTYQRWNGYQNSARIQDQR